jgi:hypothetical protein
VFSATNNDNESHPTRFDVRLDELTQAGVWDEVRLYTTGSSQEPGKPLDPAAARTLVQDSIEAGETREGLTIALGDVPPGHYRILMAYQVKVIGYNASRPEWSTPLNFPLN